MVRVEPEQVRGKRPYIGKAICSFRSDVDISPLDFDEAANRLAPKSAAVYTVTAEDPNFIANYVTDRGRTVRSFRFRIEYF